MHARGPQATGEELANAASHGLGALLALCALPLVLSSGDAARGVGVPVYVATMLLLYLASTMYHALPDGAAKQRWQRIDHAAIFLFVAGSWTPFAERAGAGAPLYALVWGLAAAGAALKLADRLRGPRASTALYVAFGTLALATVGPLVESIARELLGWLFAGSLAYSVGAVFFVLDERVRYGHLVWHLFVLSGSACHFAAMLPAA